MNIDYIIIWNLASNKHDYDDLMGSDERVPSGNQTWVAAKSTI